MKTSLSIVSGLMFASALVGCDKQPEPAQPS